VVKGSPFGDEANLGGAIDNFKSQLRDVMIKISYDPSAFS
jgi:hypothetical protein